MGPIRQLAGVGPDRPTWSWGTRTCSSVGQSTCSTRRGSAVRLRPGPPPARLARRGRVMRVMRVFVPVFPPPPGRPRPAVDSPCGWVPAPAGARPQAGRRSRCRIPRWCSGNTPSCYLGIARSSRALGAVTARAAGGCASRRRFVPGRVGSGAPARGARARGSSGCVVRSPPDRFAGVLPKGRDLCAGRAARHGPPDEVALCVRVARLGVLLR